MSLPNLSERYVLGEELGRGSIGVVSRAHDRVLDRTVAVKVLRPELLKHERHRPRFLREALICGRLGHPNIVPVFDVGVIDMPDHPGSPCLVMGLLTGRSLRTIIRSGRMSVPRQLQWFVQACNGLAFAHQQGVIHRDMKPAHVFVGDFGQVVITDWGLAKARREQEPEMGGLPDRGPLDAGRQDVTRVGDVVGTPVYMAPEQAEGRVAELDHRADIYALGAILYEILTGTRPFEASRSIDVLRALRKGPPEPPRQRAPHRDIPPALEAVCLQAMARSPADRFDSALDLAANIDAWFESDRRAGLGLDSEPPTPEQPPGTPIEHGEPPRDAPTVPRLPALSFLPASSPPGERRAEQTTSRPEDAARHLTDGRAEAAAFGRQLQEARNLETEAARVAASLPYDAPREDRARVWRLESRGRDTLEQAAWHLGHAIEHLIRSATHPAHRRDAAEGLARLHRDAWRHADERGDIISAIYHRARAEAYDERGALQAELAGRATLTVQSTPPGAGVDLSALDDRGALWSPGANLRIGETPLVRRTVSATRLVLRLIGEDGLSVRVPLRLWPGESRVVEVALPSSRLVPPGFVYIAGGRFLFGADHHAPGAAPPRDLDVAPFCIARQPVTWEEYFEFLEDGLAVGSGMEAHLPRSRGKPLVVVDGGRRVRWLPEVNAPARAPIRFISHEDARRYAGWLGRRLGVPTRLPTEEEWEFAAGGVDERPFPWGARFVPGLADTRRRGTSGPAPVGAFPDDESPFGVRSVAGGVREWTSTPAEQTGRFLLRGGSWRAWPEQCRVGARATGAAGLTHPAIGVRMVVDLG